MHKTQRKVFKELQRVENKLGRQNQRLERDGASSVYKRYKMKVDDIRANRAVRWQSSTYRPDTDNVGRSNLDELV